VAVSIELAFLCVIRHEAWYIIENYLINTDNNRTISSHAKDCSSNKCKVFGENNASVNLNRIKIINRRPEHFVVKGFMTFIANKMITIMKSRKIILTRHLA
jgi:hypothetical protein